ncbi:MAG: hypothetical protein ACJ8KC_03125, partial [Candidatus Udaeobacter sp.]
MNRLVRLKQITPPFVSALLFLLPAAFLNAGVRSAAAREIELGLTTLKRQIAASSPAGSGWTVVPSPNTGSPHNYFYGVAAITSNDVWAVGGYGNLTTQAQQLIQHWGGQNWTKVPTPTLPTAYNELQAISAVSSTDVWAVGGGDGQTLIEHWDGTSWNVVPNPNPGTFNRFFGVAALS